jgi:hypothetical protein
MRLRFALLLLALTFASSSFAALHCKLDNLGDSDTYDIPAVVVKIAKAKCKMDGKKYSVSLIGVGAELLFQLHEGFLIGCTSSKPAGNYNGLDAEAAFFLVIQLAGFANKNGVCGILGGSASWAGGFGLTGSRLKIQPE